MEEKKLGDIISDARLTAYQDGKMGETPFRIGNMDYEKQIISFLRQHMKQLGEDPVEVELAHRKDISNAQTGEGMIPNTDTTRIGHNEPPEDSPMFLDTDGQWKLKPPEDRVAQVGSGKPCGVKVMSVGALRAMSVTPQGCLNGGE